MKVLFSFEGTRKPHIWSGDNDAEDPPVPIPNTEDPPVPIPNTEVKLCSADDTWWETARESKSSPDF